MNGDLIPNVWWYLSTSLISWQSNNGWFKDIYVNVSPLLLDAPCLYIQLNNIMITYGIISILRANILNALLSKIKSNWCSNLCTSRSHSFRTKHSKHPRRVLNKQAGVVNYVLSMFTCYAACCIYCHFRPLGYLSLSWGVVALRTFLILIIMSTFKYVDTFSMICGLGSLLLTWVYLSHSLDE